MLPANYNNVGWYHGREWGVTVEGVRVYPKPPKQSFSSIVEAADASDKFYKVNLGLHVNDFPHNRWECGTLITEPVDHPDPSDPGITYHPSSGRILVHNGLAATFFFHMRDAKASRRDYKAGLADDAARRAARAGVSPYRSAYAPSYGLALSSLSPNVDTSVQPSKAKGVSFPTQASSLLPATASASASSASDSESDSAPGGSASSGSAPAPIPIPLLPPTISTTFFSSTAQGPPTPPSSPSPFSFFLGFPHQQTGGGVVGWGIRAPPTYHPPPLRSISRGPNIPPESINPTSPSSMHDKDLDIDQRHQQEQVEQVEQKKSTRFPPLDFIRQPPTPSSALRQPSQGKRLRAPPLSPLPPCLFLVPQRRLPGDPAYI